jgi:L-seryl-tRNA(Ser) seleniumtransferase
MNNLQEALQSLPGVDKLLCNKDVADLILVFGRDIVITAIRESIEYYRKQILEGEKPPLHKDIIHKTSTILNKVNQKSLKPVINATGIIIHTNLGRAPLGDEMLLDSYQNFKAYNNLEFKLDTGKRGNRNIHASEMLKKITGAEDILVVNNAAAAVLLCLNTLAKRKEVIVSRGELIEIGGSFRIPEIMKASGCKMKEVGTTNKTRISDYSDNISPSTGLLFKAHKSNYTIKGFTQEVNLNELCHIGRQYNIPVLYDQGNGLVFRQNLPIFKNEPDVKTAIETNVDLVCFSGDKLMGGPQAGIIAGKKEYIDKLRKNPLNRALRVCKLSLALLETNCSYFLNRDELVKKNMVYKLLNTSIKDLNNKAEKLAKHLKKQKIECSVIKNKTQVGGGSIPEQFIESRAVVIDKNNLSNKKRSEYAEQMFAGLLQCDTPVVSVIAQSNILFDVLTIFDNELITAADNIVYVNKKMSNY